MYVYVGWIGCILKGEGHAKITKKFGINTILDVQLTGKRTVSHLLKRFFSAYLRGIYSGSKFLPDWVEYCMTSKLDRCTCARQSPCPKVAILVKKLLF